MGKAIITFLVVAAVLAVLFYVGKKKENSSSIICTHNCSSCPNRGTCTEEVKNMR